MKRVLSNAWENDYERAYLQHIVLVLVGRETSRQRNTRRDGSGEPTAVRGWRKSSEKNCNNPIVGSDRLD